MKGVRRYRDRREAGRVLAAELRSRDLHDPLVLALPRGGVPVAAEVARALGAPLDVLLVRKVGAPGFPEYGVGAVSEDGSVHLDDDRITRLGLDRSRIAATVAAEQVRLHEYARAYRGTDGDLRPPADVLGRDVVVVDDGVATGGSALAAVAVLRHRAAAGIVLAVPVGASTGLEALAEVVDDLVCPWWVDGDFSVGSFYEDFHQLDHDEVRRLLARSASWPAPPVRRGGSRRPAPRVSPRRAP
jgi:putative phosphoribosyl transferase